ncbi:hypothetical protein HMPREF0262_00987 [Clostridium sp. ATCC 29733]|nr:hypothetical protein HMPREF0262_00987 [Clostridium sp. ATCC 29733]
MDKSTNSRHFLTFEHSTKSDNFGGKKWPGDTRAISAYDFAR